MGLDATIRAGIAIAKSVTASLQCQVQVRRWLGQDAFGTKLFGEPEFYKVILEKMTGEIQSPAGGIMTASASLLFLEPILAIAGNADRDQPLDPEDEVTLPDGTKTTVKSVQGLVDPTISSPYYLEVIVE